jgi:hypothetical protein
MKKSRFSKYATPVFVFVFSIFIIACLKEQSNTTSKSAKVDLVEFAKIHYPNIKFLPISKTKSREVSCVPDPEPDLQCETKYVQMIVPIPAIAHLPACDVTVNFNVTTCINVNNGEIYLDYTDFNYTACQEVLARLYQMQVMSYQDYQSWEELYAYHVSINAEYTYSSMVAQANPNGTIIESHFYADLCYRSRIVELGELVFAQSRDICGSACCLRSRRYTSNGGGIPPTALRWSKIAAQISP